MIMQCASDTAQGFSVSQKQSKGQQINLEVVKPGIILKELFPEVSKGQVHN